MTTEASSTTATAATSATPAAVLPPLPARITHDQVAACAGVLAVHPFEDFASVDFASVIRDLAAIDGITVLQRALCLAYISVHGSVVKQRGHAAFVLPPYITQLQPTQQRGVPLLAELTLEQLAVFRSYALLGLTECVTASSFTEWPYYVYGDLISTLASYRNEPWPAVVPCMMQLLQSEHDTVPRVGCYLLNKLFDARTARSAIRLALPLIVARLNALLQPPTAPLSTPPTTGEVHHVINRVAAAITYLVCWTAGGDDSDELRDLTSVLPLILAAQWSGAGVSTALTVTTAAAAAATDASSSSTSSSTSATKQQQSQLTMFIERLTKVIEMTINDRYEDLPSHMIEPVWLAQCKLALPPAIPNDIRVAAINVVVTIAERVPKQIRRAPALMSAGVRTCLMMMTHQTLTDDEWANDTSESDGYATVTAEKKKLAANEDKKGDEKKGGDSKESKDVKDREKIANEGCTALDRIGNALGTGRAGASFTTIALPIFNELANQGSWQYRAAAIRAFGQLGEYTQFRQLPVSQIVSYLTDAHPRVRYNAIRALSQMAHDHTPKLQNKYHAAILPAFITGLDDTLPRLQGFNAWAIGTFLTDLKGEERIPKPKPADGEEEKKKEDGNDSDDDSGPDEPDDSTGGGDEDDDDSKKRVRRPVIPVVQYYDVIMTKLLAILKSAPNHIKEDVFPCFTALCHAAPRAFSKYYDTIVPILKALVMHATAPDLSVVRSYAIETVSLIGMKNREKFKADAIEVMGPLLDLLRSGHVTATDKTHPYILRASGRICRVVGKDFAPVLPLLMPSVIAVLRRQLTPRQKQMAISARDSGMHHRAVMDAPEFKEALALMDDKVDAIDFIESIMQRIGDGYAPYIVDTAASLIPLFDTDLNEDCENAAMECVPKLIKCGITSLANNKIEKRFVLDAYMMIVEALLALMTPAEGSSNNNNNDEDADDYDPSINGRAIQALCELITAGGELSKEIWNEAAIVNVAQRVVTVIRAVMRRIRLRAQIADDLQNNGDNGEDDAEAELEKLQSEDEDYLIDVLELTTHMLKTFGGARCVPMWNTLRDTIIMLMTRPHTEFDTLKRTGVDIFCECMSHLPALTPTATATFVTAVPILLQCLPDPDFRQTCAFGLGICAKQGGAAFAPFVDTTLSALVAMINAGDSRDEENSDATDNAISSIVHIALNQGRTELLPLWLSYLPLTSETTESEVCYTILCDQIEANNGALLGANFANLPRILSVICDILHVSHTKLCTPVVRGRLCAIVTRLATLPAEAVAALNASLNDTQRATFAAVIAKSQADAAALAAAIATLSVIDATTSAAAPPS